ncbi:MAG: hypothetical protein WC683_17885 [bacterium]|nr:hypothetical protein [Syntrophorhabdaceae bacterium]
MADQPTINGLDYDFATVELKLAGAGYLRVKDFSFDDDLEPGLGYGTSPEYVAETIGQYKATGSITLYLEAAKLFRDTLGDGYGTVHFDIVANFAPPGKAVLTITATGCRVKKVGDSGTAGSDPQTEKFDLHIRRILRDGKCLVPTLS